MALLIWVLRKLSNRIKYGDVIIIYLIVYPVGRFLLDFLRLDAAMLGGINANQAAMAVVAILSSLALFWRHRKRESRISP